MRAGQATRILLIKDARIHCRQEDWIIHPEKVDSPLIVWNYGVAIYNHSKPETLIKSGNE
jgi:hypothetical protein